MIIEKCPYCGGGPMANIVYENGKQFCVLSADTSVVPVKLNFDEILALDVIACTKCGGVIFVNRQIIGKNKQ